MGLHLRIRYHLLPSISCRAMACFQKKHPGGLLCDLLGTSPLGKEVPGLTPSGIVLVLGSLNQLFSDSKNLEY